MKRFLLRVEQLSSIMGMSYGKQMYKQTQTTSSQHEMDGRYFAIEIAVSLK